MIETFLNMLEQGNDNALVRYSVGNAYVGEKKYAEAIPHLQQAIAHEQTYSAAWKLLGRSHYELKQYETAVEVCTRGIEIANAQGDKQAGKEMQVFLRRAERALSADQN